MYIIGGIILLVALALGLGLGLGLRKHGEALPDCGNANVTGVACNLGKLSLYREMHVDANAAPRCDMRMYRDVWLQWAREGDSQVDAVGQRCLPDGLHPRYRLQLILGRARQVFFGVLRHSGHRRRRRKWA